MSRYKSLLQASWIKLTNWEFWPFSVLYFPVNFYFIWLAIRCRSFFFFTSSNPSIEFGGMLGERKSDIYKLIPSIFLPKYQLIQPGGINEAKVFAREVGFPVIAKPNVGERGRLVEKICTAEELEDYAKKCAVEFLIQEYVDLPIELAVFYVRLPNQETGKITSLVQKDFLKVIGDGHKTVRALLQDSYRAVLQLDISHRRFKKILSYIPDKGEQLLIEPIGNHCRGTIFLNQGHLIDEELNRAFDKITSQIKDFYFGRFDIRCQSIEELKQLKSFKILELNGAGAEPGHIYHPGSSIWKGYQAIFWHLNVLAQISRINKQRGYKYWGLGRGLRKLRAIRQYNKILLRIIQSAK